MISEESRQADDGRLDGGLRRIRGIAVPALGVLLDTAVVGRLGALPLARVIGRAVAARFGAAAVGLVWRLTRWSLVFALLPAVVFAAGHSVLPRVFTASPEVLDSHPGRRRCRGRCGGAWRVSGPDRCFSW